MTTKEYETNEIIPRNYGLVFRNEGVSIFAAPSHYFLASVLMSNPRDIDRRLKEWQRIKKTSLAKSSHSRPEYPLFDLIDYKNILELDFGDLRDSLLSRITRKDRTTTLYSCHEGEAVLDSTFGSVVLTGNVRSRHDARKSGGQKYRKVRIHHPTLNKYGNIGFTDIYCSCDNGLWEGTKGKNMRSICYHAAALNLFFLMHAEDDKVKLKRGNPRNPISPFVVDPRHLAQTQYLDIDVLVAYYIQEMNHFEINRRLMSLGFLFFSPVLANMVLEERASYQVMKGGRKYAKVSANYIGAENNLLAKMRMRLKDAGYYMKGLCLEHPSTSFEAVGERYVSGYDPNSVITIVSATTRLPPYCIAKKLTERARLYEIPKDEDVHPFRKTRVYIAGFDDMTRRACEEKIVLPGRRLFVPEPIKERYRMVRESLGG